MQDYPGDVSASTWALKTEEICKTIKDKEKKKENKERHKVEEEIRESQSIRSWLDITVIKAWVKGPWVITYSLPLEAVNDPNQWWIDKGKFQSKACNRTK